MLGFAALLAVYESSLLFADRSYVGVDECPIFSRMTMCAQDLSGLI